MDIGFGEEIMVPRGGGSVAEFAIWNVFLILPSAKDNGYPQRMKGSGVGRLMFRKKRVGCVIGGQDVFRGGHFQSRVFNNQSVNLFRSRSQVTSALSGGKTMQDYGPPARFP